MTSRLLRLWVNLLCFTIILILTVVLSSRAYADEPWTTPSIVFETADNLASPRLIADTAGDVHLIFIYRKPIAFGGDAPTSDVIRYARLHNNSWSRPVDILSSPDNTSIRYLAIALDPHGYLHVVWTGGRFNMIFHSRAHLSQASSGRGWSVPQILSEAQNLGVDILASQDGMLHLAYAQGGADVYYRQSQDGGKSWTNQVRVSRVELATAADYPRLAIDDIGRIHAVWTQYHLPDGWPPSGAYYSRSLDQGSTWSSPWRVAGENYGMINVVAGFGKVVLAWNAIVSIGDRMYQWSDDSGQTFSPAERITNKIRGGFTGFPVLDFDSAGTLHLVTSVDVQTGTVSAIYHLSWNGKNWTEPVLISRDAVGKKSVEYPWLGASVGNQLNVVYEDDFQRVWHTSRLTDARIIASKPIPTWVAAPAKTPSNISALNAPDSISVTDPSWVGYPITVSSISVIALMTAVIAARFVNRHRN
jgi:hypothetical protein